jgi:Protein of unknown function (DUF3014)
MPDIPDYDLLRPGGPGEPEEPGPSGTRTVIWIAAALLLVAGAAIYMVYGRKSSPVAATAVKPTQATEQAIRPLGGDGDRIALPPLNDTDSIVRELVRKVTSHPAAIAWLATSGLIRNFTVVVANIVEGVTPARHLRVLKPTAAFQVIERNGQLSIDSRSYERYDAIAAAVASLDPAGTSRLYATLKPRIEEAYAELGSEPASFDRTLERAIVVLLQTPAVDGPVRIDPKGIGYRYADARLEGLTAAQKQLLRMGPKNVQAIQSALRQLALALGIPSERLP